MTSALLLNAVGATVLVGIWIAAVVHIYRSLAKDELRSPATGAERLLRSPKTRPGLLTTARGALAR
jgi:hypothetical protein